MQETLWCMDDDNIVVSILRIMCDLEEEDVSVEPGRCLKWIFGSGTGYYMYTGSAGYMDTLHWVDIAKWSGGISNITAQFCRLCGFKNIFCLADQSSVSRTIILNPVSAPKRATGVVSRAKSSFMRGTDLSRPITRRTSQLGG